MRHRSLLYLVLFGILAGGTVAVARRIQVVQDRPYDIDVLPTAQAARLLSLGHPTLAANLNWLRAVQYIGEPRADARGWAKLRPLLDLVTDLDPGHGYAYQVGANALASAGLIHDADAILEKGMSHVPDRYILPFQRAVNAFLYEGDYALAGYYFEKAAQTPGAPEHMRDYVLAMYVKGDAAEAAVKFLQHLEESAEDDESRRAIRSQLQRAILERDAGRLEAAVAAFRQRRGIRPALLDQLVMEGFVDAIPADPFGGEYYLDGEGVVRSTRFHDRFEHPAAQQGLNVEAYRKLKSLERGAQR